MRVMRIQCDLCDAVSSRYDLSMMSVSDVLSDLKEEGWSLARYSCQNLCPDCSRKRMERDVRERAQANEASRRMRS